MSFDIREHNLPLPKGWSYKKISDVARVNANTIRKKDSPDEIYYIDISSVSNGSFERPKHMLYADAPSRAKRIVKKNDFIISTVRPNLKQYVFLDEVHENWIASTGFAVVSAIEAGTEWYLYSVITSELFNEHLARVADGGAYPAFNPKEIEDAVIFWPDKDSLRVINDLAFNLNTEQKNNTQTSQILEQVAQALFKSWFVDFDPVKAKIETLATGRSADDAKLAAMSMISAKSLDELNSLKANNPEAFNKLAQTAALFPAAMQDSELGEIAEGWCKGSLSNISNLNEKSWTKKTEPSDVHYVDLANTKNGVIEFVTTYKFSESPSRARRVLTPGDTIIGTVRPGNRSYAFIGDTDKILTGSTGFAVLTPKKEFWASFIYLATTNDDSIDEYARLADGGAYPAIKSSVIAETPCTIPDKKIAQKFWNMTSAILKKAHQNRLENEELAKLRDTLLPKLLSGEIDLTNEVVA